MRVPSVFQNSTSSGLGLVADDDMDAFGGGESQRRPHDVLHQAKTAGAVQHFGGFRLHPRSQTRSENGDVYGCFHNE